jgi:hypothetical protein
MESIKDLMRIAGNRAVILIENEEDTEMARLSINGEWLMQGNYWDFHSHCGGSLIHELREKTFEWFSHQGLIEAIHLVLPKETKVLVVRRPYRYATGGGHIEPVTADDLSSAEFRVLAKVPITRHATA